VAKVWARWKEKFPGNNETDTGSALLKMIEVIWRRREGQKSSRSAWKRPDFRTRDNDEQIEPTLS
jgi:hypothetical protein